MKRPNRRSHEGVPVLVKQLRRDVDDLQRNQFVGGSSIAVTLNQTEDFWDINGTAVAAETDKQWRITFTPDVAVKPYADISFKMQMVNNNGFERLDAYPDFAYMDDDTKRTWILACSTSLVAITLYVKFYVESIDSGTISVVAL